MLFITGTIVGAFSKPNPDIMKNLYLAAILSLFSYSSSLAQPEKKDKYFGGQLSLYGYSDSGSKRFSSSLSPSLGIFVTNGWLLGPSFSYFFSRYKNAAGTPSEILSHVHKPGVGVFARRYFHITDKLFAHLSFRTKLDLVYSISSNSGITISDHKLEFINELSPGLTYFLTPKLSAFVNFGVIRYGMDTGPNPSQEFNLSLNANTFSIGVQYFLRKKTK